MISKIYCLQILIPQTKSALFVAEKMNLLQDPSANLKMKTDQLLSEDLFTSIKTVLKSINTPLSIHHSRNGSILAQCLIILCTKVLIIVIDAKLREQASNASSVASNSMGLNVQNFTLYVSQEVKASQARINACFVSTRRTTKIKYFKALQKKNQVQFVAMNT